LLGLAFAAQVMAAQLPPSRPARLYLHAGWSLQSSCKITETPEAISSLAFQAQGCYHASVPTTVLAAQVAAGESPDPYFGMNLRNIPGMGYRVGELFSLLPMPKDSPYACSWWYRTRFRLPHGYAGKKVWLHFDGINYRANIWVNGRQLAASKVVAGAYRTYEFDVTKFLLPGENVLAAEVFAPTEKDLAMNFWDWNPTPPDKDMGLWGDVYLTASGPVAVRYPQVVSHLSKDATQAELTVIAELRNASDQPVRGVVEASIAELKLRLLKRVELGPGESRVVSFTGTDSPQLRVKRPRLWWPWEMGPQNLYHLEVRVSVEGTRSDEQTVRFGIREITSEFNDRGYRLFRVNGKRILIRGGGWTPDMLLRRSEDRLEPQLRYVREMGLNAIRLEGKMQADAFYDLADEMGILIMAGWMCCDIWQTPEKWPPENEGIAIASLRSQILRLRSHPSMLVWLNGSDEPPPPAMESAYLKVLQETAWPNPVLSSASETTSQVSGSSGVKMTGPYDWVPPSYWLLDQTKYGGAWGFNTETGPGAAIPPAHSLRKFIPADHLWPIDEVWNFHAGGENFQDLKRFNRPMDAIYGPPTGLEDYVTKSQAMTYDGERAMFEAYARNKYTATGVIQWMLNNAWPSLIWHLYDYYLQPAGGYFGAKKANERLHVQYSYDDRSVVLVNNAYSAFEGISVVARVYDFRLHQTFSREERLDVEADSVTRLITLPPFAPEAASPVYFVSLSARDKAGKLVSSNFYWIPAKLSVIDWDKTADTIYTPVSTYEDLTALQQLPRVRLEGSAVLAGASGEPAVRVRMHNPSRSLAFQIHVGVRDGKSEDEALPVFWDDNYVSLLPGESRELTARYLAGKRIVHPMVAIDGWNIEPLALRPSPGATSRVQ
jgi:exo-1,4-beta-D-glucosaminidase